MMLSNVNLHTVSHIIKINMHPVTKIINIYDDAVITVALYTSNNLHTQTIWIEIVSLST